MFDSRNTASHYSSELIPARPIIEVVPLLVALANDVKYLTDSRNPGEVEARKAFSFVHVGIGVEVNNAVIVV
jgi:hypothetical protein